MEIKLENLLSAKVARVVSRNVDVSSFISATEYSEYFNDSATLENILLPEQFKEKWILVPSSYFNIYLGEVFSFYTTFTNDSIQDAMTDVIIRIDMQIGNKAFLLKELEMKTLDAKVSIDAILSHEIKEHVTHTLICTLSFNIAGHERQTCRKYFRFSVFKPIDVKTKSYYTECDEIYLEAIFQNLTNLPIQLKSVMLESGDFDVTSLHFLPGDSQDKWIFGANNRLNSSESRQYLFSLKPKEEFRFNSVKLKSVTAIGKLDIVWISGIGEKGHIQTSQLEKTASSSANLKFLVEEIPTEVYLKKIFKLKFRLINCSLKNIEPVLNFMNKENQNILWLGLASKNLGELKPSQSTIIEMSLFPINVGMHCIPTVSVEDSLSKTNSEYKDLAFVNIL